MIHDPLEFSAVFAAEQEPNSMLARKKRSIAARFSFTRERELEKVYCLALYLHVFGRNKEAIEVCNFLMQEEFHGDNSLWYHIECALGLKYVIEKQTGDYPKEHFAYIRRIPEAMEANIRLRAKTETDVQKFHQIYDGQLNGQTVESELWNEEIEVTTSIPDSCYAVIREFCRLIAANDAVGRTTFFIGGQKGSCQLFWDKYRRYLDALRRFKRIKLPIGRS